MYAYNLAPELLLSEQTTAALRSIAYFYTKYKQSQYTLFDTLPSELI